MPLPETEFLDRAALGLQAVVMHRIRAFCPKAEVLNHVATIQWENKPDHWKHQLHARPLFANGGWSKAPVPGFVPNLATAEPTVISAVFPNDTSGSQRLVRVLRRQGLGIFTDTTTIKSVDELVEVGKEDTAAERESTYDAIGKAMCFSSGMNAQELFTNHSDDGVADEYAFEETAYEVVELCFATAQSMDAIESTEPSEAQRRLQRAIVYCLTRSYDVQARKDGLTPSLERVLGELRVGALNPIVTKSGGDLRIANLSQSSRGFIALGPRGAVVAHCKDREHPQLLVSALNMIEILRGRRLMMIVARTVADNAIREISQIVDEVGASAGMPSGASNQVDARIQGKVRMASEHMLRANSLYGLVLSDPGVYLLDGSTLSRLSREADDWFGMKYLREDNQQKMDTMHRLWEHNRLKYPLVFNQY